MENMEFNFFAKKVKFIIEWPKREFQAESKFIYKSEGVFFGKSIGGFDPITYKRNQDDIAVILETLIDFIGNDFTYMLKNDGVDRAEYNLYKQELIPFSSEDFFNSKDTKIDSANGDQLYATISDSNIKNLHVKFYGQFNGEKYNYELIADVTQLFNTPDKKILEDELSNNNPGSERITSFEIIKKGYF
ncbi:hypothetical protein G7084_04475 [Weissella coleopterorum]|uniref:Uncharacterized protein n=1 Tax=Weissella coleopterorum TaxID=2714949 RepID=A0A6G8AZV8_9LACO|nr:hypothetical protein [Weissella coleopterorum]QIL50631.1 hypothetical protein G7084_04475 [Weissella coleopterorum]